MELFTYQGNRKQEVKRIMFNMMNEEGEKVSRRDIIVTAGKLAGGAVGVAAVYNLLSPLPKSEASTKMAELPWPYKKFTDKDMKEASEIAHAAWFKGFCPYATMSGIIEVLRKKVGEPYKSFPLGVVTFAHGGTSGWGATCGTLIGSGMAASLVTGPHTGEAIVNEVMHWYADTELPIYVPDHPKAVLKTKNKSETPLCHASVGKWMKKEGVGFLSAQQMERCARLSADVARKTIELLNAWSDGKFKAVNKSPVGLNEIPSQNNCTDCHGSKVPSTSGPFGTGLDLLKGGH